jgi:hypothetical protein
MARHWSFEVTDTFRLYLVCGVLIASSVLLSVARADPSHVQRIGNFILLLAVWATMRSTLREGLAKHRSLSDDQPTLPREPGARGVELNVNFLNKLAFRRGDAVLQVHGLVFALIGSVLASYGDLMLRVCLPELFG